MRKFVNGVYMDMTEEEIAEMQEDKNETTVYLPTNEERIEALEMAILELAEVLANG